MKPTRRTQPYYDDAFGHWFAGFFAGEGTLGVFPDYSGRTAYRCQAKIALRRDDRPVLEEIRTALGMGRIYDDRKGSRTRNPCAAWVIEGRDTCLSLVELFERFPLRAKKQRDLEVWAKAVREWNSVPRGRPRPQGWARMEELRTELTEARAFA